jgi:hypothetical protein
VSAGLAATAADAHRRGWFVFPVGRNPHTGQNKLPLVEWGDWTVPADRADGLFALWESSRRVTGFGIDTGRSGIVVLDEDGAAALEALCTAHDQTLPPTYTVSTDKGRHLYYLAPADGRVIRNGSHQTTGFEVDIRGLGGFVVGPGSLHASGAQYVVQDDRDPVPLPDWLMDLFGALPGEINVTAGPAMYVDETSEWGSALLDHACAKVGSTAEGSRNDTLRNEALWVFGRVKAGFIERSEALDALRAAGDACGLPSGEVDSALAGAAKDARPWLTLDELFPAIPDDVSALLADSPLDGRNAFERAAIAAADSVTNPPAVLTPMYFDPLGTPLFYGGVLNTLVGPGGIMKTTLATLAASNHAGYTLLVSLEKSRPSLLNTARWVGADTSRMLVATSTDEAEAIVNTAPADADLLVVVDSTLSFMARYGWNEDTSTDVGAMEAHLMSWYATGRVGCIVLIDHTGHTPGRARGSSRKGQMIQGRVWVLRRDQRSVIVTCEKDNSGERGLTWSYDLTRQGPVSGLSTLPAVPIEEVALAATGMQGAGIGKAWKEITAHPDYPEWQAHGLTNRRLRTAIATARTCGRHASDDELVDNSPEGESSDNAADAT